MNIQEAKKLYQKVISDREDLDYLKIIESIKKAISCKRYSLDIENIPQHVITLLKEDGYEVTFCSGFQREPDNYEIKGWVN